jgi:hypothetical protein
MTGKDDSLEKLIEAYNLVKVDFLINEQIPATATERNIQTNQSGI